MEFRRYQSQGGIGSLGRVSAPPNSARLKFTPVFAGTEHVVMKIFLAVAATILFITACAQGGAGSNSGSGSGSISMYGTIDEGISVRK
jgi:hypothetical protein